MVDKTNLDPHFIGETYKTISEIGDKIGEYIEFKEKYKELIIKQEDNRDSWIDFFEKYFKRVLADQAKKLIDVVKNRKTTGETFSKIESDLEDKKKKELEVGKIPFSELYEYMNKIKKLEFQINEKITIEKSNRKLFWKGLGVGSILGIIASIIGALIVQNFF